MSQSSSTNPSTVVVDQHAPSSSSSAKVPGQSSPDPTSTAELTSLKSRLRASLRQYPDFPSPGVLFEDFLPIFIDPELHEDLIRSLEMHISLEHQKPDVIVGLEARGFLFGPTLALRLGASFVPTRKKGKLPGPCETQGFSKEYGEDFFQMQSGSIQPGQKVFIVDDVIATGMYLLFLPFVMYLLTCGCRWLGLCCGRTRQEARRQSPRLHIRSRTRLSQGPPEAQCSRIYPSFRPGWQKGMSHIHNTRYHPRLSLHTNDEFFFFFFFFFFNDLPNVRTCLGRRFCLSDPLFSLSLPRSCFTSGSVWYLFTPTHFIIIS